MSDATAKVMDGSLWKEFCRNLEAAGETIMSAEVAANPLDRAEGFRYLTRLLRIALEMNLEWADPDFPGFYQASHTTAKIGADNPDNHYLNATVSPQRRYLITGKLGTCPILTLGTKANRYAIDGTMASTGELALEDMQVGPNGEFEIVVSKDQPQGGNWLPMADDTSFIVVRQTFRDRPNETPHQMSIRTIDGPATPAPLTPEFLASALARTNGFVAGTAKTFLHWAELFRANQVNKLDTSDQTMFIRAGGDPMIHYLHGYWTLAPDEALVIEAMPPKCRTWNFQLDNYWMESLDYRFARIHVNDFTAKPNPDGSVTLAIAARDPGFGNWIDTCGHSQGTMLWRWTGADSHPVPQTRVVKI
jgi:hypothetical protein